MSDVGNRLARTLGDMLLLHLGHVALYDTPYIAGGQRAGFFAVS